MREEDGEALFFLCLFFFPLHSERSKSLVRGAEKLYTPADATGRPRGKEKEKEQGAREQKTEERGEKLKKRRNRSMYLPKKTPLWRGLENKCPRIRMA